MQPLFSVRRADWDRDADKIRRVRKTVFVLEQNVPIELEWDGSDVDCAHMLAEASDGFPIGTGRYLGRRCFSPEDSLT